MNDVSRLRHSVWKCKDHLLWIPKCRRKVVYGKLRRELGAVFHELARQKACRIEEGHLLQDHVHVLLSIPPKYAAAQVVAFLKGKSTIQMREYSVVGGETSWGSSFGHGGTTCLPWAKMSKRYGSISDSRKSRTVGWTS